MSTQCKLDILGKVLNEIVNSKDIRNDKKDIIVNNILHMQKELKNDTTLKRDIMLKENIIKEDITKKDTLIDMLETVADMK